MNATNGFKDRAQKQGDHYRNQIDYFNLGCEILGPPQGMRGKGTPLERADRIKAGKQEYDRRNFGSG